MQGKKKIPLATPYEYYEKSYKEWAKQAISDLVTFKSKNTDIGYPLAEPLLITSILFVNHMRKVDVSNLMEAAQDVLAGDAGNFLDKTKTIQGKKHKIKFDHSTYQVIEDDNRNILTPGLPIVFYDPKNPRTELFITPLDMAKWGKAFKLLHGDDASIGYTNEDEPPLIDDTIFDSI